MDKEQLKQDLKKHIVKYANILDKTPEQITDDMPLFGPDGVGLDSIDSLEMVVMLEREYDIKLTNPTEARKILLNVEVIANYILEHKSDTN
jgi:acyl carrier protein